MRKGLEVRWRDVERQYRDERYARHGVQRTPLINDPNNQRVLSWLNEAKSGLRPHEPDDKVTTVSYEFPRGPSHEYQLHDRPKSHLQPRVSSSSKPKSGWRDRLLAKVSLALSKVAFWMEPAASAAGRPFHDHYGTFR